jgi:acyl carrier protein
MEQTIKEKILSIIRDEILIHQIDENETLRELGADSLDLTEIAVSLEDEFGIDVSDEEVKDKSVRDLITLVESKINKNV